MHRIVFIIIFLCSSILTAQQIDPAVVVSCDTQKTTVGLPVSYHVTVTNTSDLFLTLPEDRLYVEINGKQLPRYIITDKAIQKEELEGMYKWDMSCTLVFLQPGIWSLPELHIYNSDSSVINYDSPLIEIESVNREAKQEDIERPLELSGNYTRLILLVLLFFVLAFMLFWVFKRIKKHIKIKTIPEDPYADFKKEAMALYAENLIETGNVEEHMMRLSVLFRRFVSHYYRCNALELTSDELLLLLSGFNIGSVLIERIRKIVFLWDLAKFAELRPQEETTRINFKDTLKLVDELVCIGGGNA